MCRISIVLKLMHCGIVRIGIVSDVISLSEKKPEPFVTNGITLGELLWEFVSLEPFRLSPARALR
jgi:hypothetical protein